MKRKIMFLLTLLFVGISVVNAQTLDVKGLVLSSEDGLPIVGATVIVEGTQKGTITNYDGRFVLSGVPTSAKKLKISYIGMLSKVVAIKPDMTVTLEPDTKVLDEVVVVAYGTMKKSAFTGSASQLDSKKIELRQVSSATNALAGTTSGVQITNASGRPGNDPTIRIRGIGSISASSSPLYVVDGVPYDGTISNINPADIASMNVLKDASASAIYGARGANGVVLITTKKGKGKEAVVTFDAKWGTNSRLLDAGNVMKNSDDYFESFYRALYNSNYYYQDGNARNVAAAHSYAASHLIDRLGYQIYTVPDGEPTVGTDFKMNPNAKLGYSDGQYYYLPDNWSDEMYKDNNLRQEYNATISGSSDKINFYMSLGYLDDSGVIEGSNYTRYTGRLKADYQAKKWLKVGANLAYSHIDDKGLGDSSSWGSSGNPFYVGDTMPPIYPFYVRDLDGNIVVDDMGMIVYDLGTNTNQARGNSGAIGNPAVSLNYNSSVRKRNTINATGFAEVSLYKGLKFKANIGLYNSDSRSNYLSNPYYLSSTHGSVTVAHNRFTTLNKQFLLTYNKQLGLHDISLLGGYETYEKTIQALSASKKTIYLDNVAELDNAVVENGLPTSDTQEYSTEGFLFRGQYNYDGKYFGTISYRRDASSRFDPDKRWGDFGSVGAAWILTKEDFMEGTSDWLDMLKFKASYGIQGNDNLGNYYPYLDQYTVSVSNGEPKLIFDFKGNKDITWETSYSFNTGFDFNLWNGMLEGSIEYYNRKTVDMLYYKAVAPSKGYSSMPINQGDMYNRGLELSLTSNVYHTKDIDVNLNFNLTSVKNRITSIEEYTSGQAIYKEGGSIYTAYLREFAGVYASDKIGTKDNNVAGLTYADGINLIEGDALYYVDPDKGDYTVTNVWNNANRSDRGDTLADIYGGFGLQANAYGFDASIQFAYQMGGKIYDSAYQAQMSSNASNNWNMDIQNAWTPENTNTNIPRLDLAVSDSQYSSTRFLVSSDYLCLNNVTVGYTLPKELTAKLNINRLRFYFSGENLALWSHRDGLDPRRSTGGGIQSVTSAYATGQYSALRTITGGVSVSF